MLAACRFELRGQLWKLLPFDGLTSIVAGSIKILARAVPRGLRE
jgi:hypothetical protein